MLEFVLQRVPIWGVFIITVAAVMLSMWVGFLAGDHHHRRTEGKLEAPIGGVVGAILGLLAFILAMTFSGASSRFDARKQLLLDDVDAISTAVRRAEFLPEPHRSASLGLLKRYVDLRVQAVQQPGRLGRMITESESIHRRLWRGAIVLARAGRTPEVGGYIESLNRMMAVHMRRATVALHYRIPTVIWFGLVALTICAMGTVGYQFGSAGRVSWIVNAGLATGFAAVIVIIALLDRTSQGGIMVNQQPMIDLQRSMSADQDSVPAR